MSTKTVGVGSSLVSKLDDYDKKLSKKIQDWELGIFEYIIAVFGAAFTDHETIWIPTMISLLIAKYHAIGYNMVLYYVIGIPITALWWTCMKYIFRRQRPDNNLGASRKYDFRLKQGTSYSFPSGDSVQAAFYATFFFLLYSNILYLIVFPWVAFARVYYKWHWVGDTLLGGFVGATFACIYFCCIQG